MALTSEQEALVAQLKDIAPYGTKDDDALYAIIVTEGSVTKAAVYLWESEAKSSARYMNMAEGSSRRDLTVIHKNALSMAEYFAGKAADEDGNVNGGRTMTRRIVRGTRVDS